MIYGGNQMSKVICDAISRRARMRISYDGGRRLIEPHCHGTSTAGNEVLRAFQVSGFSKSGETTGWKMFRVAKIASTEILRDEFETNRPGYNPADRGMAHVHCHV